MPRISLHGGAPGYLGQQISDETSLLEQFKTSLTAAGWTIANDDIAANKLLLMQGTTSNGHSCWLELTAVDNPGLLDGKILRLRGDLDGTGTDYGGYSTAEFVAGVANYLWLVADEDAIAFSLWGFGGTATLLYGGFRERIDLNAPFAWGTGQGIWKLEKHLIAKKAVNAAIWETLADGFSASDSENILKKANSTGTYATFLDPAVVALPYNSSNNQQSQNAAYLHEQGAVNTATNKPEIALKVSAIEGRGSETDYDSPGNGAPPVLFNQGFIKHLARGGAAYPSRVIFKDIYGGVYLTSGDNQLLLVLVEPSLPTVSAPPLAINGDTGAQTYPGVIFTTETELLTNLKNNFTAVAATVTDEITTNKRILVELTTANAHKAYVEFRTFNGAGGNRKILAVRGDLDGTGSNLSPDTLQVSFTEGANNLYWQSGDFDSGGLAIAGFGYEAFGFHYGFLDRYDLNNDKAWMVGYIDNLLANSYIATDRLGQIWHEMAEHFNDTFSSSLTDASAPLEGVCDRHTVCFKPYNAPRSTSNRNAAYNFDYGSVNGVDNKYITDEYYYRSNRSTSFNQFGSLNYPFDLDREGSVKWAAVGLASATAGTIDIKTNGEVYLSCGAAFKGQGLRIA